MKTAAGGHALLLGCLCLLSVACVSTGPSLETQRLDLQERLRSRGIDPDELVDPLELTDEMRTWARENVRNSFDEGERLESLMAALTHKEGLAVRYERDFTGTARDVFDTGQANCLSFTNLFIALARELDIGAYYLKIERGSRYEQEGDLVVRWEHVTAAWDRGAERKVLEFGFIPEDSYRTAVRLSDTTALGMFYSNRGAEALLAGETREALDWLETAIAVDPDWSHSWLNLGVVRRRLGDLAGAEEAYRAGIDRDPNHLQLYANLAALMRARGDHDAAGELLALLDRRSNRNPFLYRGLGDAALRDGRLEDAHRFYRRALKLDSRNADTHAAMGLWELENDNLKGARGRLERAERLDPESERAALLRGRLEERAQSSQGTPGDGGTLESNGGNGRIVR